MRYLRVVDTIGQVNHLAVGPTPSGSAIGLGLLETVSFQRLRSCTLGNMIMICRRLDENTGFGSTTDKSDLFCFDTPHGVAASADNDDDAAPDYLSHGGGGGMGGDGNDDNPIYVMVASDEGLTEASLNRIANLIAEVAGYLCIPHPTNDRLFLMFLRYVDSQMAARDLSFLNQSIERIDETKIPPMWDPRLSIREYKGNIIMHALNNAPQCRCPGYAVGMYGHKILLDTNAQFTSEAREMNSDECEASDGVRYIVALLTAAFYSSPLMDYTSDNTPTEHELRLAENALSRFGIHRHNAGRNASEKLIQRTLKHLRMGVPGKKHPETQSADSYEAAFELLKSWNELMARPVRHTYHHMDKLRPKRQDQEWTASDRHVFDFLFFDDDGEEHIGCLQFCWTPVPTPDGEFSELYPKGVGTGVLYFGCDDWDPRCQVQPVLPISILQEQLADLYSPNCMELSFVAINWLSHPPLSGFSIPGLVNFFCVDRRRNRGLVCSKEEVIGGCRTEEGKRSIHQLHHTMHHCVSQAQELLSQGYSEGMWGHLGMQFVYQITVQKETSTTAALGAIGGNSDGKDQKDSRTLSDPELVKTFITAPFNAASTNRLESNEFLLEMYAMFVGSMNPREVQAQVQQLMRALFDQKLL